MSDQTAVYRLYDAEDSLLYVGITATPKKRFSEHAASKPWWPRVTRHSINWADSRGQALDEERRAIENEKPLYNSQHALPCLAADVAVVFAQYKHDYEMEKRLRGPMKEMAARELKAGASVGQLAKWTGLTPEVFRRMARDLGIERKRPPTVGRLGQTAVAEGLSMGLVTQAEMDGTEESNA